eukprot:1649108-Amphidinium_carterae.1
MVYILGMEDESPEFQFTPTGWLNASEEVILDQHSVEESKNSLPSPRSTPLPLAFSNLQHSILSLTRLVSGNMHSEYKTHPLAVAQLEDSADLLDFYLKITAHIQNHQMADFWWSIKNARHWTTSPAADSSFQVAQLVLVV